MRWRVLESSSYIHRDRYSISAMLERKVVGAQDEEEEKQYL